MANFLSYNTTNGDDLVAPDPPILAGATIAMGIGWDPPLSDPTSPAGPVNGQDSVWTGTGMTGIANTIAISYFASLGGTLVVQQSFDGINWDIQNEYAVDPLTVNDGINQQVIAPYLSLLYTNAGAEEDPEVRIYARVFGSGRNSST